MRLRMMHLCCSAARRIAAGGAGLLLAVALVVALDGAQGQTRTRPDASSPQPQLQSPRLRLDRLPAPHEALMRAQQRVHVGNFTGQPYRNAEAALARESGRLKLIPEPVPSAQRRDEVISQEPHDTDVPVGSTIRFRISDGTLVRVPPLLNKPQQQARQILRRVGLDMKSERPDVTPGTVLTQNPGPGDTVRRGTVISVTVEVPPSVMPRPPDRVNPPAAPVPALIYVPRIVGQPQADARRLLGEATAAARVEPLKVEVETRRSKLPRGQVVWQAPMNQWVRGGSVVKLRVSDQSLVEMPQLIGRTNEEADALLRRYGLVGKWMPPREADPSAAGKVVEQQPPHGDDVVRGSTVEVTVGFAPPVPPPNTVSPELASPAAPARVTPQRVQPQPESPPAEQDVAEPAVLDASAPADASSAVERGTPSPASETPPPTVAASTPEVPAATASQVAPPPATAAALTPAEPVTAASQPAIGTRDDATAQSLVDRAVAWVRHPDQRALWQAVAAALAAAGAATWLVRRRIVRRRAAAPQVHTRFLGPLSQPRLATSEGAPLRVTLSLSALAPCARPEAITQEALHE